MCTVFMLASAIVDVNVLQEVRVRGGNDLWF
jgi:hypothetical protein